MPDPASLSFLLLWVVPYLFVATGLVARSRKRDLLYPSLLGFLFFLGLHLLFLSLRLPPGEDEPGPGFVPSALCVFLSLSCLLELLQYLRITEAKPEQVRSPQGMRLAALVLICIVYLIAIDFAGFFVSTTLFLVLSGALLGARSLAQGLAITVCWLGAIYLLFVQVLQMSLPEGALF